MANQMPQRRDFDGEYLRTTDGEYQRIFVPAWWEPWRWLRWWMSKSRGWVTMTFKTDEWQGRYRLRVLPSSDGIVRADMADVRIKESP